MKHALHQTLDGANVDFGLRFRRYIAHPLESKNISKGADTDDFGGAEFTLCLEAKRVTIHYKTDAAKPLYLQQPVEESYREFGLTGSGRHRDQYFTLILFENCLNCFDCAALIRP